MKNNNPSTKTALHTALNYLSRRQMTSSQLSRKLEQKEFDSNQIAEAIARLTEWRYLDDSSYTVSYCRTKRDRHSRARIKMELLNAGVEQEVIDSVFEEYYPRDREYLNCLELGQKLLPLESEKYRKRLEKDNKKSSYPLDIYLKKKIGEKLFQKGYPLDIIQKVLQELMSLNDK